MHIKNTEKFRRAETENFEYSDFISLPNLFQAWNEFKVGKRKKKDVMRFERYLETHLYNLYLVLENKTYKHNSYSSFYVQDPKLRHIHKASVTDRVVHHLLYKYLYEVFDRTFVFDSYSCRLDKGTHKGVLRLEKFTRIVSKNYTKDCWALKLDIKKFFASVDHEILLGLLSKKIQNQDILWLLKQVIDSFHTEYGKGIPLGNLTSQVFANIYLNELDQFVKHKLKVKYYIRHADDFLLLSDNKAFLNQCLTLLTQFLEKNLKLMLHPNKIIFRKLDWGIDFLGYIVLPYYRLPRTKTTKRMMKKLTSKIEDCNSGRISRESLHQTIQSCLGFLSHAHTYRLTQEIKNLVWFLRIM